MQVAMPNCLLSNSHRGYCRPTTACRQTALLPTQCNQSARSAPKHLKVELCRNYIEQQYCQYGDRCCFAHGYNELSSAALQKLRTKPCRLFHQHSACKYGYRCNFQHQTRQLQQVVGLSRQTHRNNILEWYPQVLLTAGGNSSRLFK